jgi:negative regulator of flagellin synthesis FlgM
MGIEISGNNGRPAQEALDASKTTSSNTGNRGTTGASTKPGPGDSDRVQLSNQASQLQALEAKVSSLPVVDTQRVQDVQRTLATGSFQIEPARVADKMLRFEAGLGES